MCSDSINKGEFPWRFDVEDPDPEVKVPPVRRRIGYWMSAKKLRKMDMKKLAVLCRSGGYELVQIDMDRPLERQGPFDIILHKLTDVIVRAELGDPADPETVFLRDVESYMLNHPRTVIIDAIEDVKKLIFRGRQYSLTAESDACMDDEEPGTKFSTVERNGGWVDESKWKARLGMDGSDWMETRIESPSRIFTARQEKVKVFSPAFVAFSTSEPQEMLSELEKADIRFPVVCKPQAAHGSDAHRMMIVFNAAGLARVKEEVKLPCVAQSFVNHDAILYKLFVIGDKCHVDIRPSFHNFQSSDFKRLPPIVFDSQDICKASWLCNSDFPDPHIPIAANSRSRSFFTLWPALTKRIVSGIRRQFGLSLIGIDLVLESRPCGCPPSVKCAECAEVSRKFAIIDINAFPGYDGYPNFFQELFSFLQASAPTTPASTPDSKTVLTKGVAPGVERFQSRKVPKIGS